MAAKIQAITMPKWGIEMQEGTVTGWHVVVGQTIGKGDPLLDVETDKIVNAVESPVAGRLRRLLAESGSTLPVGALIAVCAEAEVPDADIDAFVAAFRPVDASFEPDSDGAAARAPAAAAPDNSSGAADGESRVSPIARRLAEKLGIDPQRIKGTGRNGRVSKEDVEAYAAGLAAGTPATAPTTSPANGAGLVREKLSATRATIARRLLESTQSIPHYRLAIDVTLDELLATRRTLKAAGTAVSLNDLLLHAVARALVQHPDLNAEFVGDEIIRHGDADLGVAVATDNGLVAPVLRAANRLDVAALSAAVADLVARARSGRLTRDDLSGGSFTVSNLGMHGIDRFDAIINPPQVAILAVGRGVEHVVARRGVPAVATMLTLTLSADHRVVDGAVGARFLDTLRQLIESPGQR
jgi:pyruvate dehydrogenase E2 component (dihydrolipoamide acetyltransferase)